MLMAEYFFEKIQSSSKVKRPYKKAASLNGTSPFRDAAFCVSVLHKGPALFRALPFGLVPHFAKPYLRFFQPRAAAAPASSINPATAAIPPTSP
ncbi:MAG: hypothetical protein UGF45_10565, partial [Massilioclostridium sp.]|nr:hypothetical protein [Massilioclostridium sp.]